MCELFKLELIDFPTVLISLTGTGPGRFCLGNCHCFDVMSNENEHREKVQFPVENINTVGFFFFMGGHCGCLGTGKAGERNRKRRGHRACVF